jgi:signal transduction histidine kinase
MTDKNDVRLLDLPYSCWEWIPTTGELTIDGEDSSTEGRILTVKDTNAHCRGWEKLLPPSKAKELEGSILALLANNRDFHLRLHVSDALGPRNLILHGMVAETSAEGIPHRIIGLCRPETQEDGQDDARSAFDSNRLEERRMEALLQNAKRFEDTARLAGSIAHDLNNLLAPIRMATELLHRKVEDKSVERYITIIEDSTARARSVIQQILAFAKTSEKGAQQPVDVENVLRELERIVSETFPRRLTCEFIFAESMPRVLMDPTQLHQALLNILVNARDAIEGEGAIKVRTSLKNVEFAVLASGRSLAPGAYVCISISDTGCGISKDILDQIFDPFFTTKPKEQGTGLGLASVFGIVARVGGIIDVESTPGKGSTFHVYLPEESA